MIFWSKGPHTKEEHIKANKDRDIRVRAHQLHMQSSAEQDEQASKSTGHMEAQNASEGLDADMGSQLGRQKQVASQMVQGKVKQLGKMRGRVRLGRRRARARGRSLGF